MVNIWEILGRLDSEVVVSVVADEPLPAEINSLADDGDDDYERLERIAIQSVEAETEFLRVWPAVMESLRGVLGEDVVACLMRAEFGGLVE